MNLRKLPPSAIFSLVAILSWSPVVSGQHIRLNVGYSAIGADQLPAWIAKDTGIAARYGLNEQLIYFNGGTTAVLALVSGDVPITQVSGPGLVNSALAGSDAVFVAGGITSLDYVLLGRPGVSKPDQLKGGTLAISRFGSATDATAGFALSKLGLRPGIDVTIVQVGSGPDRLNAALTGKVTAVIIDPITGFMGESKGLVAIDRDSVGLVFQHTGVATTRKFISQHRDIVSRYVKTQVEAVHTIWNDKEASIKALARYMGQGVDRALLERSWGNLLSESKLPKTQYPSLRGLKTVLAQVAERVPRAREAKPEDFVDLSFIEELDKSGFVKSLYKTK